MWHGRPACDHRRHRANSANTSPSPSPSPRDGRIRLEILLDRTSIELFGNDGEVALTSCFLPPPNDHTLELFATAAPARIVSMEAYPLKSVCRKAIPLSPHFLKEGLKFEAE